MRAQYAPSMEHLITLPLRAATPISPLAPAREVMENTEGAVEAWAKEQTPLADTLGRAGSGAMNSILVTLAGSVATLITVMVLMPLTDQLFLLLVLTADGAIVIKVLHDAIFEWQFPSARAGRWTPAMLNFLNFFYLVLFFCATTLALAMFGSIVVVSSAFAVGGVFGALFLAFNILLFISHPAFGLLSHPGMDVAKLADS